jgi:hypothetical protein
VTNDGDQPTPEELAYVLYEGLIDPLDEANLRAQEAEGQPVGHLREQRRRELAELLPALGLGDHVADLEAAR